MTATSSAPAPQVTLPSGLTSKNRRQRRWSLALVGILLILGSGLLFMLLFVNAGDRSPVLAVARDVPAGQVITGGDLRIVRVGADPGVDTISEARRSDVIGQTAAVDLLPELDPQPISEEVLREKYLKDGETTREQLFARVARALASVEAPDRRAEFEPRFLALLQQGGIGAGRIMSAAGTELQAFVERSVAEYRALAVEFGLPVR